MPVFTDAEKATICEIVGLSRFPIIEEYTAGSLWTANAQVVDEFNLLEQRGALLNTEQVNRIISDLTTWDTIKDSHVKLLGGSDGVNLDTGRKRQAIRNRVCASLGYASSNSAQIVRS